MEKKQYHLMHRDEVMCSILIGPITGAIMKASRPSAPELLPLGGSIDSAMLRKWWQRQAVPVGQGNIRRIMERIDITTHAYTLSSTHGSLTDFLPLEEYGSYIFLQSSFLSYALFTGAESFFGKTISLFRISASRLFSWYAS